MRSKASGIDACNDHFLVNRQRDAATRYIVNIFCRCMWLARSHFLKRRTSRKASDKMAANFDLWSSMEATISSQQTTALATETFTLVVGSRAGGKSALVQSLAPQGRGE